MHVIRDNYCILAIFFVSLHCVRRKAAFGKVQASLTLLSFALSLHCHSLRTANGKLTTKKRRENDRGAHLPYLFLIVEPLKKERKKKLKKEVWKTILQVIIAVLTAVGTTLGVTSCM